MKLAQFFEHTQRLDELRLRYKDKRGSGVYQLIAHRGNVWLLSGDPPPAVIADITKSTGVENSGHFIPSLEERPDIFIGYYDESTNSVDYMNPTSVGHHPVSSPLIKKLTQHLGLSDLTTQSGGYYGSNDAEVSYSKYDMLGDIPDIMYHGTSASAIPNIQRVGLDPNTTHGNWENVGKFQLVFMVADFASATFHANKSAYDKSEIPIVLEIQVPDKSQIVPDYDAASLIISDDDLEIADEVGYTGSKNWGGYNNQFRKTAKDVAKYSKDIDPIKTSGVVGYRRRIPAKFIKAVYVGFDILDSAIMGNAFPAIPAIPDQAYRFKNWDKLRSALDFYEEYEYWHDGAEEELAAEMEED